VNLILVLRRFDHARADALREPLRTARAAFGATVMFLLAEEIGDAAEAFAVKFADVLRRRRVLHGTDPFAALSVSREAQLRRLRQVLLNQALRMRERYATVSLREEQLARALVDAAGPLRSAVQPDVSGDFARPEVEDQRILGPRRRRREQNDHQGRNEWGTRLWVGWVRTHPASEHPILGSEVSRKGASRGFRERHAVLS